MKVPTSADSESASPCLCQASTARIAAAARLVDRSAERAADQRLVDRQLAGLPGRVSFRCGRTSLVDGEQRRDQRGDQRQRDAHEQPAEAPVLAPLVAGLLLEGALLGLGVVAPTGPGTPAPAGAAGRPARAAHSRAAASRTPV